MQQGSRATGGAIEGGPQDEPAERQRSERASEAPRAPARSQQRPARPSASSGDSRTLALLGSIRAIQMELKRLEPARVIGLSGNPAAPESALLVAELRLGRKLPPSYREFLAFSDGWTSFFNGASLLGTGEIGRAGALDAAHERLLARGRLLPFGADRAGASLFAFDTSIRLADGELGVVAWVGGLGIDCRCFTSFLMTVLQLCRAELSAVRGAEPLPAARATPAERGWLDVG
jgi:SMI1/KNR4 family protein SUKH-1